MSILVKISDNISSLSGKIIFTALCCSNSSVFAWQLGLNVLLLLLRLLTQFCCHRHQDCSQAQICSLSVAISVTVNRLLQNWLAPTMLERHLWANSDYGQLRAALGQKKESCFCPHCNLYISQNTLGSGHTGPIQTVCGTMRVHMIWHGTVQYCTTLWMHAYLQSVRKGLDPSKIHRNCVEPYSSAQTTADLRQIVRNCLHYSRHVQFLWTAVC